MDAAAQKEPVAVSHSAIILRLRVEEAGLTARVKQNMRKNNNYSAGQPGPPTVGN